MRSVKPGRGPSAMGAAGSVVSIVFGIIWTIFAFNLTKGSPFPMVGIVFPLFGVVFVGLGIVQAVIHFKNATGRNRMSLYDIVDSDEEPDPFERRRDDRGANIHATADQGRETSDRTDGFCPYCGTALRSEFAFCPKCGRQTTERAQ